MKHICLIVIQQLKQAWLRLQFAANVRDQKRRKQIAWAEYEIDRLDRLRNPSKYQGNY